MDQAPFSLAHIDALIFDMDGTVVDNIAHHDRSWVQWAKEAGLGHSESELLSHVYGTITEVMGRILPGTPVEELLAHGERKEALYREMYQPHLTPIPGLKEFLIWAQDQSLPISLATAGGSKNVDFVLDGLEIRSHFKELVAGEDVTNGKPHPEVFLIAAQRLGIPPERCLAFEDSISGVEAVRRAGMKCIVVNQIAPREQFGDTTHVLAWHNDYQTLTQILQRTQTDEKFVPGITSIHSAHIP